MGKKKIDRQSNKNRFILLGMSFALIMLILVLVNVFSGNTKFSEQENRVLSSKPALTSENVTSGRYTSEYETYVNDQFPLRNAWIKLKITMDRLEGKQESNGVYRCSDGYLMEKFVKPSKDKNEDTMSAIRKFSKRHSDLETYMLLVPDSCNTYPELLPTGAPIDNQNTYIDDVFDSLSAAGINNIDVRETFKKHKDNVQLYYHSDHHWTSEGARVAFMETANAMGFKADVTPDEPETVDYNFEGMLSSKSGFYDAGNDTIDVYFPTEKTPGSIVTYVDTQEKSCSFYKSENLDKKDAYTVFTGGNHSLIKINTATERKQNLLIIKDSYANCFVPFIAPYFRNVYVVDPRYYFNNLNKLIKNNDITDVLFLYSANALSEDTALKAMLSE